MVTNYNKNYPLVSFNAKKKFLDKPIENVQTALETSVDTFVNNPNEDKNRKKLRKRAIAASSSVLVLGTLTLLLNPRGSSKTSKYLKNLHEKVSSKIKDTGENTFKNKVLNFWKKVLSGAEKCGNLYFNLNSGKDWVWDALCTNNNKKYRAPTMIYE